MICMKNNKKIKWKFLSFFWKFSNFHHIFELFPKIVVFPLIVHRLLLLLIE